MASLAQPTETGQDVGRRLEAARVAHRDAQEVAHRCAAKFRETVLEAVDAGVNQDVVARIAGISRARVHAIIVTESARP